MISVKEARRIIDDHISIVPQEKVSINVAEGRVLAQDIVASFPQPRFNNSAMDGFAVRAADTKGASKKNPVDLRMVGVVSAGSLGDIVVGPGQCAQCMTGALIPEGADAIVMVESSSGYESGPEVQMLSLIHI